MLLQLSLPLHVPHEPPQPSLPHSLPAQTGVQGVRACDSSIAALPQPGMTVAMKRRDNPANSGNRLLRATCENASCVPLGFMWVR